MDTKKTEEPLTELNFRISKLEDGHNSVKKIHDEWPVLEARVSNLENKHTVIDNIQRRVDKIEASIEIVTTKVSTIDESTKKLTVEISEFKDNMRGEFNRLIKWVTIIIVGSLVGGLAAMYQYQGGMFKSMGIKIGKVENATTKKCSDIEKDIIKMNVKIDTMGRN